MEYRELLQGFEMHSLNKRRAVASLLFLYDIIRGRIQEQGMLSKININVPRVNGRYNGTFRPPVPRTNALKNSVLQRICNLYNRIGINNPHCDLDIFHQKRLHFRKLLKELDPQLLTGHAGSG